MYPTLDASEQPPVVGALQEPAPQQGMVVGDVVHPIAVEPVQGIQGDVVHPIAVEPVQGIQGDVVHPIAMQPAQGIQNAPVHPIVSSPPVTGVRPIEPLRGSESRPVEPLRFYSSPSASRESDRRPGSRQHRPPSRGSYQPAQEGKGGSTLGGTDHKETRRHTDTGVGQKGAISKGQMGKGKPVREGACGEWSDVPGFNGFVKVRTKRYQSTPGAPYPARDSGGGSSSAAGAFRGGGGSGNFTHMWDHKHWLEQYSVAVANGNNMLAKKLRQQVADHNFGMYKRNIGNLGSVPETVYVSYVDTVRKRVSGTGRDSIISFSGATTMEAIMHFARVRRNQVCALNFANGEHVGGGYVRGAKAQEEDLCRTFPLLYTSLQRAKNNGLYPYGPPVSAGISKYSDVLFTPQVLCCRAEESEGYRMLQERERFTASFVSGAAPNVRKGENFDRERFVQAIKNVLIAPRIYAPGLNVLLLGAWGCGAFGCDPEVVAECYIEVLRLPIARLWHEIHFPIPCSNSNENAIIFSATLKKAFPDMRIYEQMGSL